MSKAMAGTVCALAMVALAAGWAAAGEAGKGSAVSVNGWITDSYCGGKNASAEGKSCALKCMEKGAKLVLYSEADKKTFALDKQEEAKAHVGVEVRVTGTLDEATSTIKVEKIEPAKKDEKKG